MSATAFRASCLTAVFAGCILITNSIAAGSSATEATPPLPSSHFAAQAKATFVKARDRFQTDTNNTEAAWQFARACFDLGEFATSSAERAEVAETGIAVARQLVARQPTSTEGHYYLAMNMGQLARTKTLGALRLVDSMEVEFQTARKLNEKFDYAGPDRNLGQLYLEAPSFGSIGNRTKARQHLRRAALLAPHYPENRIILIEAYIRWGETAAAAKEYKLLAQGWSKAREQFTGDQWTMSWRDWEKRFERMKVELKEQLNKLEAPKH